MFPKIRIATPRCFSIAAAVTLAAIQISGCKKPAPPGAPPPAPPAGTADLPGLDPEKPEVAFHEPQEVETAAKESIRNEAAATAKSEEQIREERIKKEVVQDYQALTPVAGDGAAASNGGKLCWRAFTCSHPNCTGQGKNGNPFVFAYRYEGVVVGPDGQPDWTQNAGKEPMTMLGICPACGRANTVQPYYPPDVAAKAREIDKKVNRIKAGITAAMRNGAQAPREMFAEMDDALKERAELPVFYLCE